MTEYIHVWLGRKSFAFGGLVIFLNNPFLNIIYVANCFNFRVHRYFSLQV